MKFVMAKCSVALIKINVAEEESRTGRKVERVLLTPTEWIEMLESEGGTYAGLQSIRIPVIEPFGARMAARYIIVERDRV